MANLLTRGGWRVAMAALAALAAPAWGQGGRNVAGGLTALLPPETNQLLLIDVAGLHASEAGKKNDWQTKHAEAFAMREVPYPPATRAVVLGATMDSRSWSHETNEVGLYLLSEPATLDGIAKREVGVSETILGQRVLRVGNSGYVAALGENVVASYHPGQRQSFSRWLAATKKPPAGGSPFLAEAAKRWPKEGQVVLAFDMEQTGNVDEILASLKNNPAMAGVDESERVKLAEELATLRGMRLSINVTENINAKLVVEFAQPVDACRESMEKLLRQGGNALNHAGINLKDWNLKCDSSAAMFEQVLSPEQFREFLRSVQPSVQNDLSADIAARQSEVESARKYVRGVTNILNYLDKTTSDLNNYLASALEYERAARQIERLRTDGVDAEAVAFGDRVRQTLTGIAAQLRGVPATAAALDAGTRGLHHYPAYTPPGVYWAGGTYPWNWGMASSPGEVNPRLQANQDLVEKQNAERQDRLAKWREMREAGVQLRRKLSEKFGVAF